MVKSARFLFCLTTVSSPRVADRIAHILVREKIIACANLIPGIVSHYVWKGKACREREILLMMKTTSTQIKTLKQRLPQLHPYQVPELVILKVKDGLSAYLDWIQKSVDEKS